MRPPASKMDKGVPKLLMPRNTTVPTWGSGKCWLWFLFLNQCGLCVSGHNGPPLLWAHVPWTPCTHGWYITGIAIYYLKLGIQECLELKTTQCRGILTWQSSCQNVLYAKRNLFLNCDVETIFVHLFVLTSWRVCWRMFVTYCTSHNQ